MVFPLDEKKVSQMQQDAAISDDEDMEDLRNNYQWTPKNIMLPQDSKDGDFELHVQTFNDNDEVQQEQSFDSNMMPIETKFRKLVRQKTANDPKNFKGKYDQMEEDDARSNRSFDARDDEQQQREISNIENID